MLDRNTIEERQRERAAALEDLTRAKRELAEAAKRLAEREEQLGQRERRLEQRMQRAARKLETRRDRQDRIAALRTKVSENEFLKGRQKRKDSEPDRGEQQLSRRETDLSHRDASSSTGRRARAPDSGRSSPGSSSWTHVTRRPGA